MARRCELTGDATDKETANQWETLAEIADFYERALLNQILLLQHPEKIQPERNHQFKESKSWVGENKNRKFSEVDRGGWMSCDMKSDLNGK